MIKLGVLTPIWIICGLLSLSAEASVLSRFTCFVNRFKNHPSQVTPMEATRPQVARAPAAISEPAPVSEGVVALTHRMETAQAVIANLYKNHDYVHSIGPSLQEEEMGESNIAVHRVQTESGPAVLKVELMKQEPNLKLRIALRSEDRARLEPFLKDLPHQIRARLELLELPGVSLLRTWARDPSLLLTDGKTMLISRQRSMSG